MAADQLGEMVVARGGGCNNCLQPVAGQDWLEIIYENSYVVTEVRDGFVCKENKE